MFIDKYLFILILLSFILGLGIQIWIGFNVNKIEKSFQTLYEIRFKELERLQEQGLP